MNGGWIDERDSRAAGQKERGPAASIHPAAHGISSITDHGVSTPYGDYTFFLIRPDNLSVLSEDAIRQRVGNLANLISNRDEVTILALDSRASFLRNKLFYQARLEEETEPAIRRLLQLDLEHLDEIQASSASKREL